MTKYLKTAFQFGILGGILSLASFIVLSFLYPDPTNLNLIFGYIITPIALFLGIKFFKDYTNSGYLSFAEGMTVGFVTYVLMGILASLGIWVVLFFSPELFSSIQQTKWAVLEENKDIIISQVGQESFELTRSNLKGMTKWDVAFNDGIWKIIPGMFFSIIISIILRKNPN
ncbi:DUF4199 domain-containing protein [Algoriphagus sp. AK58]|uniref:DUF4199 domain-containing protein n=1 Tax=Algoriphagus sp. AK58 TaxID=1406877 RepID=UPI0016500BE7|nr:DUF4199 domain-containing protein [Algoriphagus sp. AK58]MBC6368474.1 DUF4199 domain-containing protein [Algoriphagus sp. AK58]